MLPQSSIVDESDGQSEDDSDTPVTMVSSSSSSAAFDPVTGFPLKCKPGTILGTGYQILYEAGHPMVPPCSAIHDSLIYLARML